MCFTGRYTKISLCVGGLFTVTLEYNCELKNRAQCKPELKIKRVDQDKENDGFFRYIANYSKPKNAIENNDNTYYRDLQKVYVLRFVFKIGKSSLIFRLKTWMSIRGVPS